MSTRWKDLKPGDLVSFMETRYDLDGAPKIKVHALLVRLHYRQSWGDRRCIWNLLRCDTGKIGIVHDTGITLEHRR